MPNHSHIRYDSLRQAVFKTVVQCNGTNSLLLLVLAGYILGGGQGDLSRMFGLACDQLVRAQSRRGSFAHSCAAPEAFTGHLQMSEQANCEWYVVVGYSIVQQHASGNCLCARSCSLVSAACLFDTSPCRQLVLLLLLLLLPTCQVGLELVTYRGDVVTASAQHNSDLLWASCGGGGGLGVVTQWLVKAHDLGNEPFSRITVSVW
jgi:FAD/FMN-containing dehydrogenase